MAEFLLDSLVERRAIVGDASFECDVAAKNGSPQGRGETILQFAGSGMDLSLISLGRRRVWCIDTCGNAIDGAD